MAKLPISRVVNVTLTRQDRFPTRDGFGIILILTSVLSEGSPLSSSVRTRVYGSMEEVAEDWATSTEAYKAATAAFAQNPRPVQIKIGYVDPAVLEGEPASALVAEVADVIAYDDDWYWLLFTKEFRDLAIMDDVAELIETQPRQLFLGSNDTDMEDPGDTGNIAARLKGGAFERTSVWYHWDDDYYLDVAAAAYAATRNLDQVDTAYTLKFKRLATIAPINKNSAAVQAITGFTPNLGLDADEGHLANTYVNIGGLDMVVEGNTLSRAFVDEIHAGDWMVARTQEETLAVLANNDRVPMTNTGMQMLVSAVELVMSRAAAAGLIADVLDEITGETLLAYDIEHDSTEAIPASQRRSRIAPDIRCTFRYAGAVHYSTVRLTMTF